MNIGDKAPEILGKDEKGRDIRLSDYKGRKLVLYFYPKDNTSGCTAEACSLRDHYGELQGKGYEVVGVSKDSAASHVKFKEKHELPFPLIADVDDRDYLSELVRETCKELPEPKPKKKKK